MLLFGSHFQFWKALTGTIFVVYISREKTRTAKPFSNLQVSSFSFFNKSEEAWKCTNQHHQSKPLRNDLFSCPPKSSFSFSDTCTCDWKLEHFAIFLLLTIFGEIMFFLWFQQVLKGVLKKASCLSLLWLPFWGKAFGGRWCWWCNERSTGRHEPDLNLFEEPTVPSNSF